MHLASNEGRTWNACCLSLRPKERNIGSLLTGAKASDKRCTVTETKRPTGTTDPGGWRPHHRK